MELIGETLLPDGFRYPPLFIRVIDCGLTQLEPWWIIQGELLTERFTGVKARYPERVLVPFAVRQDNDDVACWDVSADDVAVIHDFAEPGYEDRGRFDDFAAWLRQALEDLIDFE